MNGKKPSPWLRILALCTAVALGGGYVWKQQQKAAPQVTAPVPPLPKEEPKPDERVVLSGSKSLVVDPSFTPPRVEVWEPGTGNRAILPSSKIGIIEMKPEEKKERTLLPSSKSKVISPDQTLLPGSKGGLIDFKPNDPKNRTLLPGSKSFTVVPPRQPESPQPPAQPQTEKP